MMKSKIDREREPDIRKLFDRDGNEITREEGIRKALSNQGSEIAGHKLILSPGDNAVDLVGYTKDQMRILEERFNARIDYTFSYQKNTDHYHIHVTLPARGERRLDLSVAEPDGKVDIRLSRDDFAAMREGGKKFLRDYNFVDHLTDHNVRRDLLGDWYDDARNHEKDYNKRMRKDLGLELTEADVSALKEIGIDIDAVLRERGIHIPSRNWQQGQQSHKRIIEPSERGEDLVKDELGEYLLKRGVDFETSWSDKEVARILQTSERDPEWIFPAAYSTHLKKSEETTHEIESLYKDFAKSPETSPPGEQQHRDDREIPVGDPRHATELESSSDIDTTGYEYEDGAYLPLPGYGLERLERDSGYLVADPSEIQIDLTPDKQQRQRRDDDEFEEGHHRQ